jgi:anti-anti-sigma regulatory factor
MCRRCPSAQFRLEDFLTASLLSSSQAHDATAELIAAGAWTASNAAELERLVQWIVAETDRSQATAIDMRGVEYLDTYGALLLERLCRSGRGHGRRLRIIGLEGRYQGLLQEVQLLNPRLPEHPAYGGAALRALESLGDGVSKIARDIAIFLNLAGALTKAVLRLLRQPMKFRLTSAVHHLDRVGWQAVPIILLITFLIGGIIAQQGFFHFRKFRRVLGGAEGKRERRVAWVADYGLRRQIDLSRDRARWIVRHLLRLDRNVTGMNAVDDNLAVRVRDLVVGFGDYVALDHLSLDVRRGEILGFVGGSGSGKSVRLRTILGLLPKRQGSI